MKKYIHHVKQHQPLIPGMDAISLLTEHSFPRHSHDQFGIGIVIQGTQRSWSHLGNVQASAGDIIMVNPGEIHDGQPLQGPRGWHMIFFEPDVMAQELQHDSKTQDILMSPVVTDPALSSHMRTMFDKINAPHPDSTAIEEAFILSLMRVTQYHIFSKLPLKKYTPPVILAKQYLDDCPEEKITLSQLAALCDISRFQLIRAFSHELGITPHAYLVQSRIRLARKLLSGGKTIIDTALMTGFADQSHLTRAFQKQFGMTPGYFLSARE